MLEFPPPPPGVKPSDYLPRCRQCSYILIGLESPKCPECGTEFDPRAPSTYIRCTPFRPWTYWFPPVTVALGATAIIVILGTASREMILGLLASIPITLGIIVGYSRNLTTVLTLVMFVYLMGLIFGVVVSGPNGTWPSLKHAVGAAYLLGLLLLFLLWFGSLIGTVLRLVLKRHNFSQSDWLP